MVRGFPFALLGILLAGCEPLSITMFGLGAATGVNHALGGIVYKTFSVPLPKVKRSALAALKRMAIKVGARPVRCYDAADVVMGPAPWTGTCPGCGHQAKRHRRPTRTTA